MKLALSTLVVLLALAVCLHQTSAAPFIGPFADLSLPALPQFRIPTVDNIISAPGRAIDSGMRSMRRQTENFSRAVGRAGNRFQSGLSNLNPGTFMQSLQNMLSGLPVIG